jgi:hypothetical protein
MSRRPRTVHEQRVARALRTMAPGGRLASESPVRRPRFTGGAPSTVAPVWSGFWGATYAEASTGTYDLGDLGGWLFGTPAFAAGDVLVLLAGGRNTTITVPTGWTVLDSDTVGVLSAVVAWRQLTGTDDFTGSVSPAYTAHPDYDGYADFAVLRWESTDLTPVASLTMTAADRSVELVEPPGGVAQSNGWIGGTVANGLSPVISSAPSGSEIVSPDIINIGVCQLDANPPGISTGFVDATADCDWAAWTLTWT